MAPLKSLLVKERPVGASFVSVKVHLAASHFDYTGYSASS